MKFLVYSPTIPKTLTLFEEYDEEKLVLSKKRKKSISYFVIVRLCPDLVGYL